MQVVIPEEAIKKAVQQQYFKKTDAANLCGISTTTFREWMKATPIPTVVVEGQVLYSREDLIKFMEEHKKWEK